MSYQPKYKVGDEVIVSIPKYGHHRLVITRKEEGNDANECTYYAAGFYFSDAQIEGLVFSAGELTPKNERALVLFEAERLINGDRAQAYGDPSVNFGRLAQLWAPILGAEITPTQVALCLTQLKISRLINTPDHRDSYIDAAGYIALGAELAKEKK